MSVEMTISIILSACLGYALGVYRERHNNSVLSYNVMLLMQTELQECQRQIRGLANPGVLSPLHRLPRKVYDTQWEKAVLIGDFTSAQVKAITDYYYFVDQINRGMEQTHDAKVRGNQKHLVDEARRVTMKASKVASKEGTEEDLYQAALDVVSAHLEKSRQRRIL